MTVGLLSLASPPIGWQTLRLGDGGEVQNICFMPDGTAVCRTDTYGAYLLNRTTGLWDQLFSTNSLPSGVYSIGSGGCYEAVVAPSNTQIFYAIFVGCIIKSTNQGVTWSETNFPIDANDYSNDDASKGSGYKIAVDPQNPNFLCIAQPYDWNLTPTNSGVSWSADGGTTYTTIPVSSIPACLASGSSAGNYGIAFDPTSSVSGGKKQGIYVFSYGNGLYHSSNAGVTWAPCTGGTTPPTTFSQQIVVDPNGYVWVHDDSYSAGDGWGYLHVYVPGTGWSTLTTPLYNIISCWAIDPVHTGIGTTHIYIGEGTGLLDAGHEDCYSTDSGATWTQILSGYTFTATDVPWLAWYSGSSGTGNGAWQFDPYGSNQLYNCNGLGVLTCNPPTTNAVVNWTSKTANIEQLVTKAMSVSPNGNVFTVVEDQGVMVNTNVAVYPSTHGTNASFSAGNGVDWASTSHNTIVAMCTWVGNDTSGVSSDGGVNWTSFNTLTGSSPPTSYWIPYNQATGNPPGGTDGGCIAASTSTNFCAFRSDGTGNNHLYYTTNGGVTWTAATGLPTSFGNFPYYGGRVNLVADRVTAGTFYLQLSGGVYISTNQGASWTNSNALNPGSYNGNSKMRCDPLVAGFVFYTPGRASNDGLYYSNDGAAAIWTKVTNTLNIYDVDFGAPAPGHTNSSIWMYGTLNSVGPGFWLSIDGMVTWTQMDGQYPVVAGLGATPAGEFDYLTSIAADPNIFKRVYAGTQGHGSIYRTFT